MYRVVPASLRLFFPLKRELPVAVMDGDDAALGGAVVAGEAEARGVEDGLQALGGHLEDADLAGGAVPRRAVDAVQGARRGSAGVDGSPASEGLQRLSRGTADPDPGDHLPGVTKHHR